MISSILGVAIYLVLLVTMRRDDEVTFDIRRGERERKKYCQKLRQLTQSINPAKIRYKI